MFSKIVNYFKKRQEEWEGLCLRCGLCCHERYISRNQLHINLNAPCEYLDKSNNTCRIYENRFKTCPECRKVNILHALFSSYLPPGCGYIKHYRKSKP